MKKEKLTNRQGEVLEFIKEFIKRQGYAPSLRDIAEHFGIRGPQNAGKHLDALEKKGYIKRTPRLARGIELKEESKEAMPDAPARALVPIVGNVRAGSPELAIEDIQGEAAIDPALFNCHETEGLFLLNIEGSSMTNAGIDEGDYILVRPQKTARNRDIIVAMVNGEATVKRFFRHDDYILLQPENSAMRPIIVQSSDLTGTDGGFEVIGKVISVIKNIG